MKEIEVISDEEMERRYEQCSSEPAAKFKELLEQQSAILHKRAGIKGEYDPSYLRRSYDTLLSPHVPYGTFSNTTLTWFATGLMAGLAFGIALAS